MLFFVYKTFRDAYKLFQELNEIEKSLGGNDGIIKRFDSLDFSNTLELRRYIESVNENLLQTNDPYCLSRLYNVRSIVNYKLGDIGEAFLDISNSLKIFDSLHARAIKGLYQYCMSQSTNNTWEIVEAMRNLTSIYDEKYSESLIKFEILEKTLQNATSEYVRLFATLKPAQRRFICFTDKIAAMGNNILTLPLDQVPELLTFSDGLPCKNIIYEVHPYKPNHYLNLNNFEFDLFQDKVREFQWIMENLGAKRISIKVVTDKSKNIDSDNRTQFGSEGEYAQFSASGQYSNNRTSSNYEVLKLSLEENSNFLLTDDTPHLPKEDSLTWYPHIKDWQDKVNSRLSGRTDSFNVRLESKAEYSMTNTLETELEAEMKYLMARVKGHNALSSEYRITTSDTHIWQVGVEFYPLSCYNKEDNVSNRQQSPHDNLLSPEEKDYLETFRACVADGTVSERERKLLKKISDKAGIPENRIPELEAMVEMPRKKSFLDRLFS